MEFGYRRPLTLLRKEIECKSRETASNRFWERAFKKALESGDTSELAAAMQCCNDFEIFRIRLRQEHHDRRMKSISVDENDIQNVMLEQTRVNLIKMLESLKSDTTST